MGRIGYTSIGHDYGSAILFVIEHGGNVRTAAVPGYRTPGSEYSAGHYVTHTDVFEDVENPEKVVFQGRVCPHTKRASLLAANQKQDARKLEYAARRIAKQFGVVVEVFQYNSGWLCQVI